MIAVQVSDLPRVLVGLLQTAYVCVCVEVCRRFKVFFLKGVASHDSSLSSLVFLYRRSIFILQFKSIVLYRDVAFTASVFVAFTASVSC